MPVSPEAIATNKGLDGGTETVTFVNRTETTHNQARHINPDYALTVSGSSPRSFKSLANADRQI